MSIIRGSTVFRWTYVHVCERGSVGQFGREGKDKRGSGGVVAKPTALLHVRGIDGSPTQSGSVVNERYRHILHGERERVTKSSLIQFQYTV